MNVHENAGLTPKGREIVISRLDRGEHPIDVATAMGVSSSTVYKWRGRYRAEGLAGPRDRSSRPNASPNRTPADIEASVIALRNERRICSRIAAEVGVSRAAAASSSGLVVEIGLFMARDDGNQGPPENVCPAPQTVT
jgi:transposase-like protein